jgi:cyclopropane fatty-acyl-phospholipid synthase-like methyltransferase
MPHPAPGREPIPPASCEDIYKDGEYLKKNPTWHVEESPFKAKYIREILRRNNLSPKTVCEAGCGAGEVLRQLQLQMGADCEFWGYEISPQAIHFCRSRENDRLHFKLADLGKERGVNFDLLLVLDVVEHLEDYFTFLREIRPQAKHKIFHFPLDISVQAVVRERGLMTRREQHAHLHYFSKDTALQTLKDTSYQVLDYFYLPRSNEIGPTLLQIAFSFPRAISFAIHKDLAVRVLGGYSLLILAT